MTGPFKMKRGSAPKFTDLGSSPTKHEDKIGEGSNLGNQDAADEHNQKHVDNPNWGDDHTGELKSPAKQTKEATPVDPKKVAAWQEKQKAACAAKSGHEWRDGSCWGPGKYAAHQKRIADIKAGK